MRKQGCADMILTVGFSIKFFQVELEEKETHDN